MSKTVMLLTFGVAINQELSTLQKVSILGILYMSMEERSPTTNTWTLGRREV